MKYLKICFFFPNKYLLKRASKALQRLSTSHVKLPGSSCENIEHN